MWSPHMDRDRATAASRSPSNAAAHTPAAAAICGSASSIGASASPPRTRTSGARRTRSCGWTRPLRDRALRELQHRQKTSHAPCRELEPAGGSSAQTISSPDTRPSGGDGAAHALDVGHPRGHPHVQCPAESSPSGCGPARTRSHPGCQITSRVGRAGMAQSGWGSGEGMTFS